MLNFPAPPYDPFMVVNQDRSMEVHLPGNSATDLGNNGTPIVTGVNKDIDGDYQNEMQVCHGQLM